MGLLVLQGGIGSVTAFEFSMASSSHRRTNSGTTSRRAEAGEAFRGRRAAQVGGVDSLYVLDIC